MAFEWADEMEAALKVPPELIEEARLDLEADYLVGALRARWPLAIWGASLLCILITPWSWWQLIPGTVTSCWLISRERILGYVRELYIDGFEAGYIARVRLEMHITDDTLKYLRDRKTLVGQMAENMIKGKAAK